MAASMVCRRSIRKLRNFCLRRSNVRAFSDRKNSSSGAYFVFIPEVPVDTRDTNPIMRVEDYPEFSKLVPDNIISGCAKLSQEFDSKLDLFLEELTSNSKEHSFEELFNFLEKILMPMQYADNQARILSYTNQLKYPKKMYDRVSGQIERSKNERFFSEDFNNLLKKLDEKRSELTDEQKRVLDMNLLECKLTGLTLNDKSQSLLNSAFRSIMDKENEFLKKTVFHKSLFALDVGAGSWDVAKELPLQVRLSTALDKTQPDKGPWRINLLGHVYSSFLDMCPRRDFRFKVWNAYHTVGTHITTDIRLHTFQIPEDIRMARADISKCLGYNSYAELSMETKMAGSVNEVLHLLDTYRCHFLPMAKQELKEVQKYAASRGFREELKQWDIPFYRRLHCQEKFKISNVYRRGYFSIDNVFNKMFQLSERLFQIKFERVPADQVDRWHKDVSVYDVYDLDGTQVSRLYIDPYARIGSKMRMNSVEVGRERSSVLGVTPITFLVLNLDKISFPGVPTLLSYKEVLSTFYQFGSALQQLLTTANYSEVSGQKNIEWDALHTCSYVMEMFAMQPQVIKDMSEHFQSGKILTDEEISRLLQCQRHMKSFDICHELYKSAFDIECHLGYKSYWKDVQKEMYKLFMPVELHNEDWIWCSDPTLWIGRSHAAAYYQYLWSEMLAANIFEEFSEAGMDNEKQLAKVGKRYRDTYLSLGGSLPAKQVFRQLMGRDPSINCLIKKYSNKNSDGSNGL